MIGLDYKEIICCGHWCHLCRNSDRVIVGNSSEACLLVSPDISPSTNGIFAKETD